MPGETNWTATKISADAANKFQIDAGLLLNKFNVKSPNEPADADIICETTGDYNIKAVPETKDFFEDVNNASTGYMEGMEIVKWDCTLSVTSISVTEETIMLALGAAEGTATEGISPRDHYEEKDFKGLYWIGDMKDSTKLLVVEMTHAISTGGLEFSSTNKEKGKLALNFKAVGSLKDKKKIPMNFYILTKGEALSPAAAASVTEETM